MNTNSLRPSTRSRARRVLAAVIRPAALALLATQAYAGNTWDGGGGDDNWGTGDNWNPNGSPSPGGGNDLFFDGATRLTPFNNYGAFDDWRNITFNSGASSFNITGSAIDLFGKIENMSANPQTFGLSAIALNSASANEFNPVSGNLTITSAEIFTNGNQLKVFGNNGNTLTFSAGTVIKQGGSLAINQNSTVVFNSAHTYTGDTFINAGVLQINSGGSASSSTIRLGDTSGAVAAKLALASGATLNSTVVVRSGSSGVKTIESLATSGTSTVSGGVFLDANVTTSTVTGGTLAFTGASFDLKNQTLTANGAGTTTISGVLGNSVGSGKLTKNDAGTLTLTGANTFTGATIVNGGTLEAAAAGALGGTTSITANSGGTLLLSGAGDRINNGAAFDLAGGTFNSAGLSETVGTLTLSVASTIDFASGEEALTFAGASASWTGTLSIHNWTGTTSTAGTPGSTDQLIFSSLTNVAGHLGQISFFSDAGSTFLGTGLLIGNEVVPVPEPTGVLVGLAMCGLAGWRERRKSEARRRQERRAVVS